jgi:hypothetical protein
LASTFCTLTFEPFKPSCIQVSVMQSSDVVVLGRGSRYGGNVAFLPQDRAIIEILPLGLDPTPAADVAQALDLRYVDGLFHFLGGRGKVGGVDVS